MRKQSSLPGSRGSSTGSIPKQSLLAERKCIMARLDLAEKDILNPSEAIDYFVLSRRKFYDLLKNTDDKDFLAYYGERKLILRVAFEKYLLHHPELRRRG